jgi:hypothetical protein
MLATCETAEICMGGIAGKGRNIYMAGRAIAHLT